MAAPVYIRWPDHSFEDGYRQAAYASVDEAQGQAAHDLLELGLEVAGIFDEDGKRLRSATEIRKVARNG